MENVVVKEKTYSIKFDMARCINGCLIQKMFPLGKLVCMKKVAFSTVYINTKLIPNNNFFPINCKSNREFFTICISLFLQTHKKSNVIFYRYVAFFILSTNFVWP